ncbi:MAG: outer membrane protein assembly factor BamE [Gammaproteobacteria bacterium]
MNTRRFSRATALALIAGSLCAMPPAHAAGDEAAQLRNEVNALKQKLDRLETRLRAIESKKSAQHNAPAKPSSTNQPAPPAAAQSGAPAAEASAETAEQPNEPDPAAALDKAWKSLSRGMSQDEVHKLLGEPTRRLQFPPDTIWYYTYRGKGSGSVTISSDGRVIDWQHPPHIGGWF